MTEKALLSAYASTNDINYLGEALQRYATILLGVGLQYLDDINIVHDVIQQVYLKALEKVQPNIQNLGGWLYIVMKNECMDILRTHGRIQEHTDQHIVIDENKDEEYYIQQSFKEEQLIIILNTLKVEHKVALQYFYLENKSYQQISEITGWNINEVKSYIQNGKRNLKIRLEAANFNK